MPRKTKPPAPPETTPPPPPVSPPLPQKTWSLATPPQSAPPKPRGRFVLVEPPKESLRVLFRHEAKTALLRLVDAARSQFELLHLFSLQFRGDSETLSWHEVTSVLEFHGLLAEFENKERIAFAAALLRSRCSLDKLSKSWNTRPDALKKRMAELDLEENFHQLRKHFAAKIVDSPNLRHQLRALSRPGYLKDLGICPNTFKQQLTAKLKTLLEALPPEAQTPEIQLQELTKKLQLDKNSLSLVLQQLKIF